MREPSQHTQYPDARYPRGGLPGTLPGFAGSLQNRASRDFVAWASGTAAPGLVLERAGFDVFDLRPWLGDLSILQWDAAAGDYRYRLFGTHWATTLQRDLTGQLLSRWPEELAHAIRVRLDGVIGSGRPVGAHVRVARFEAEGVEQGQSRFEQVLWPLSYGATGGDAVLLLAVRLPDEDADSQVGPPTQGHWFGPDGRLLGPAPAWPG